MWEPPCRVLSHVYDRDSAVSGVQQNQAPPLPSLSHVLLPLLGSMRARCTVAATVKEGMELTRDVALFAFAFYILVSARF